jgi:hypothetical protein
MLLLEIKLISSFINKKFISRVLNLLCAPALSSILFVFFTPWKFMKVFHINKIVYLGYYSKVS